MNKRERGHRRKAELRVIHAEPVADDIVDFLEGAIEKARAGEFSSVAIATVSRDGSAGNGWSRIPSYAAMLGSISRLQNKVLREMDD